MIVETRNIIQLQPMDSDQLTDRPDKLDRLCHPVGSHMRGKVMSHLLRANSADSLREVGLRRQEQFIKVHV